MDEKDIDDLCLIKNLSINDKYESKSENIDDKSSLHNHVKIEKNIKIKYFDKIKYFENIEIIISNILSRKNNNIITYDILDND
jgi:hypothetical protein